MLLLKQVKRGWLNTFGTAAAFNRSRVSLLAALKTGRQSLAISNESYLPAIDGVRAIAVLIVLTAHFGLGKYIPGGFGVMVFFFISGFLITRLLISEYEKRRGIDLKKFFFRRLLRLYPPLLLMLLVFPAALILAGHQLAPKEILAVLFYFENYYLVYFPNAHSTAGYFNIFWSLAVEEHFYFIYPAFFLLAYRSRYFTKGLIILILVALALRLYYVSLLESPLLTGYDDPSYEPTYMLSHCRYDSILFGCLAAIWVHQENRLYEKLCNNKLVFLLAFAVLLLCFISRSDFFRNSYRYSLQGLALMFIIPPVLLIQRFSYLNKILSVRWLVWVGKLSYSLYVMHWIGIILAGDLYPSKPFLYLDVTKPWPWYLVAVPVTVGLSLFSYYVVERKFIELRRKFGSVAK